MKAEYIDHLGDDLRVVNAARVSFDKESNWQQWSPDDPDSKTLGHLDKKLIIYLAKHNHWTPFSHCVITMRETVPIFVARQRFKHTVGFTYNEVSRRYVDDVPEFYYPEGWRKRADNKKQGSTDELVVDKMENKLSIEQNYEMFIDSVKNGYKHLLDMGVAPEQARMILPQSTYTSYYVTGSLAAWARAYKLRSDSHAQKEIQELASQWDQIISPLYPYSWKALTTNV